ncbi:hypothetical protein Hanom_Chr17g01561621 [Helianthus anomalus]
MILNKTFIYFCITTNITKTLYKSRFFILELGISLYDFSLNT